MKIQSFDKGGSVGKICIEQMSFKPKVMDGGSSENKNECYCEVNVKEID